MANARARSGGRSARKGRGRPVRVGVLSAAAAAAVLLLSGVVYAAVIPTASNQASNEAMPFAASPAANASPTKSPTKTPTPTPTPVTTTQDEIVTESIAFERTTVEDRALPRGQTVITTAGQNGERTLTYVVTLVDGVESGRELASDTVTVPPVAEVTAVGIYDPPPPPAAPSCDPNYADACVPIDSDVDCAGGSGNGPSYFDGVARVVGTDIYDLDRDGDGYACETW